MIRRLVLAFFAVSLAAGSVMGAEIPRQAPEFVIKLPTGAQLLLSQYQGKVVALAFILTTCPHCQFTCGKLETFYKEYGPQGVQALAVATNDMATMLVPEFVKMNRLTFPVGVSPSEPSYAFLQHPMVLRMMMPQLVFIDRKGVVRAQFAGDDKFFTEADQEKNMREEILKLLKGDPATGTSTKSKSAKPSSKKGAS